MLLSPAQSLTPKISIIVAVYNSLPYLERCLMSLKTQTELSAEFIIVNDGSTDGSGDLCDKYASQDNRFKVFHHKENRGLLAARKTGILETSSYICTFLDGDDYLSTPNVAATLIDVMEKENVDIVRFSHELVGGSSRDRRNMEKWLQIRGVHKIQTSLDILKKQFSRQPNMSWNFVMRCYKTSIVKKLLTFIPDTHLVCAEDAFLSFLIACHCTSFKIVNTEPMYTYRLNSGVTTGQITLEKFIALTKELQIIQWLNSFLIQGQFSDDYFIYLNDLKSRLIRDLISKWWSLPKSNRVAAMQHILSYGFQDEILSTLKERLTKQQAEMLTNIISSVPLPELDNHSSFFESLQNKSKTKIADKFSRFIKKLFP